MGSTLLAHTGTRCSISALALNLSRLIRTRHHLSHRRGDELILNWNGSWNVSENPENLVCVSITHCPWYSGKLRERFGGGEFLEFLSVMFIWTHRVAAMQFEASCRCLGSYGRPVVVCFALFSQPAKDTQGVKQKKCIAHKKIL